MALIQKSGWTLVKEYLLITLGILTYVLGWTIFLLPNHLVGGGVSGISSLIQYATGIKMGYTYFILNIVLLIFGIKILGSSFGGKTIYAIILASIGLNVLQDIIPQDFVNAISVENGRMLSTIIGGAIVGTGIGITFSAGGSTGGTDIIALILNKKYGYQPGRAIILMDVVIISSSLLVPMVIPEGVTSVLAYRVATVIYGLILVTVNGYVVDLYLSGTKQSVELMVFTEKYSEIADAITKDLHRGVTVMPAKGWYTQKDGYVVIIVARRTEINPILSYVKALDPKAFVTVSSVAGVYGKGFDVIKTKAHKES